MEKQKMLANLKATIAARRLRQVDVAIELKIPPSVLSEVINGRRQANASVRARLAELLNANEVWLFSTFIRIPNLGQSDQPGENAPHPEAVSAAAG